MQFSSVQFPHPFRAKSMQRDHINKAPCVVLDWNETQQTPISTNAEETQHYT